MHLVGNYKKIVVLLAIAVLFSTVAPVRVFAEDASFITNVVFTSESTGGVSSKGQDGKNGEDGKSGQDGKSGASGSSVNIDGQSNASVYIKSTNSVAEVQKTQTVSEVDLTTTTQHTTTSSPVETQESLLRTDVAASNGGALLALQEAFFSLQLMLVTYVSLLF